MKKFTMQHKLVALATGLVLGTSSWSAMAQSADLNQVNNALDCLTANTCVSGGSSPAVVSTTTAKQLSASDITTLAIAAQDFDNRLTKIERKANAGVANALALQAPGTHSPGKTVLRLGAGYYNKEAAVGASFRATSDNGRYSLTGGVATNVKEKFQGVAANVGAEFAIDTW